MYCPWEFRNNVVLIGNKVDLNEERQVSEEEAREFVTRFELINYFETSASTNQNVDLAFFTVALQAFELTK
jgi:GTPase SAR1 family protein